MDPKEQIDQQRLQALIERESKSDGRRTRGLCRPVVCTETGDPFPSCREAARWLGERIGRDVFPTSITASVRLGMAAHGHHFAYIPTPGGPSTPRQARSRREAATAQRGIPVMCVSPRKYFPSQAEAARWVFEWTGLPTPQQLVCDAVNKGGTCRGLRFVRADQADFLKKLNTEAA